MVTKRVVAQPELRSSVRAATTALGVNRSQYLVSQYLVVASLIMRHLLVDRAAVPNLTPPPPDPKPDAEAHP